MGHAGEGGGVGDLIGVIARAGGGQIARCGAHQLDQIGSIFNGVDPLRGQRGMAGLAAQARAHRMFGLVAGDHVHQGRLAHKAAQRFNGPGRQLGDHGPHADAAHLLVIGKGQMQRQAQAGCNHLRDQRQADRDKALHVAGAAPVKAPVALGQGEGVVGPDLPLHGHHIRMAGQDIAAGVLRADGGEERGLLAGFVGDARAGDAQLRQIGFDIGDERQVALVAHRIESDEIAEDARDAIHDGFKQHVSYP